MIRVKGWGYGSGLGLGFGSWLGLGLGLESELGSQSALELELELWLGLRARTRARARARARASKYVNLSRDSSTILSVFQHPVILCDTGLGLGLGLENNLRKARIQNGHLLILYQTRMIRVIFRVRGRRAIWVWCIPRVILGLGLGSAPLGCSLLGRSRTQVASLHHSCWGLG